MYMRGDTDEFRMAALVLAKMGEAKVVFEALRTPASQVLHAPKVPPLATERAHLPACVWGAAKSGEGLYGLKILGKRPLKVECFPSLGMDKGPSVEGYDLRIGGIAQLEVVLVVVVAVAPPQGDAGAGALQALVRVFTRACRCAARQASGDFRICGLQGEEEEPAALLVLLRPVLGDAELEGGRPPHVEPPPLVRRHPVLIEPADPHQFLHHVAEGQGGLDTVALGLKDRRGAQRQVEGVPLHRGALGDLHPLVRRWWYRTRRPEHVHMLHVQQVNVLLELGHDEVLGAELGALLRMWPLPGLLLLDELFSAGLRLREQHRLPIDRLLSNLELPPGRVQLPLHRTLRVGAVRLLEGLERPSLLPTMTGPRGPLSGRLQLRDHDEEDGQTKR
mmetsp:Transcript_3327/g.7531  ORF Transcript_3327/g.7531 Transcript_3327/m.7531 type:complete len:391 (+) Transcript_3327:586-1758(+)